MRTNKKTKRSIGVSAVKSISKYLLFALCFFTVSDGGVCQVKTDAQKIIHTLSSVRMNGRGYAHGGNEKTARFIERRFKKWGLTFFGKSYGQSFTMPVNTFPSSMSLKIDGKKKRAGKDFIIEAGSPSSSGKFETVYIDSIALFDDDLFYRAVAKAGKKWVVLPAIDRYKLSPAEAEQYARRLSFLRYDPRNLSMGGMVLTREKLVWGAASEQYAKPLLLVSEEGLRGAEIKEIEIDARAVFYPDYPVRNIIGKIDGEIKDSFIVVSAHYDHLGMMGKKVFFPGANDNASGVALLLALAKYYAAHPPKHTVVFMAFTGEEAGLAGSSYFVEHPAFDLRRIVFLINFDMVGTGEEGIQVVNGSVYEKEFDRLKRLNEEERLLPEARVRGAACNSDHCPFDRKGVPCFFIYTLGGVRAYHDIYDRANALPLTGFESLFRLTIRFIRQF